MAQRVRLFSLKISIERERSSRFLFALPWTETDLAAKETRGGEEEKNKIVLLLDQRHIEDAKSVNTCKNYNTTATGSFNKLDKLQLIARKRICTKMFAFHSLSRNKIIYETK